MTLLVMHVRALTVIPLGVLALLRPALFTSGYERRLHELRSGAEERYFEERRQLEAYPIFRNRPRVRLFGTFLLLLGICGLLL